MMKHIIENISKNLLSQYLERTPLRKSLWLSKLTDGHVYLKLENMNPIGSFKVRGALNALSELHKLHHKNHPDTPMRVVAASAGNHSQGVAYAAQKVGCEAHIFLPKTAFAFKRKATEKLGAYIYDEGENFEEAYEAAIKFAKEKNAYYINAFNDQNIILGQATCALEAHEQYQQEAQKNKALRSDPDYFVCAIGGGGLASGACLYFHEVKHTQVVGVEHECFGSAFKSLSQKTLETADLSIPSTIADGIAVKRIGDLTFKYLLEYMDKVMTVTEDDIYHAVAKIYKHENIIVEGAGGASVAAILKHPNFFKHKSTIICISGGNIDPDVFQKVLRITKDTV